MKTKSLIYNAKIYSQADPRPFESIAIYKNRIVAVGRNLKDEDEFKKYDKIDMKGRTIIPGLVDAHTHFYYMAISLGRVSLDGVDSLDKCLDKIKKFASKLSKNEWVVGEGYSPDRFKKRIEPTKEMLDKICGGRPAFIFSKDMHSAWVNSKALEAVSITNKIKDPVGGKYERDVNGELTGIIREKPAYIAIHDKIPRLSKTKINKLYKQALQIAYEQGVTGVHSFDSPEGYEYFKELAGKNRLGLRINYYFPADVLNDLIKNKVYYGQGDEFLRVAGLKIFSDGALGSQTALCFNKYIGSKDNFGIEVTSVKKMESYIKKAARLGLPSAIHAIGDKAVSNVLDAFESSPQIHFGARHRIEHMQMIRRKDLKRVRDLNVVASMQPSHCPSDIKMVHKYWGARGKNAYLFKTASENDIDLAFGSDAPIEPLKPLEGIAAAVRRARPKSRDVFYPEERISAREAVFHYTVGSALASGQEHSRGYLLPGYPADFIVLSEDITRTKPSKLYDVKCLMTVIDGKIKYSTV